MRERPAYLLPVNMALPPIGRCSHSPTESVLNLLKLGGFLWGCKHQKLVDGTRAEDGFDECEAADTVHELSLPSVESASHAVDKRLKLCSCRTLDREWDARGDDG